jgi:hypothetical protein
MKKALLVSILAVMLTAALTGCSPASDPSSSSSPSATQAAKANDKAASGEKGKLGNFEVTILDAKKAKDQSGRDAVIISYKFKNNSDEDTTFAAELTAEASQDKSELLYAVVPNSDDFSSLALSEPVAPGKSITVQKAFLLADATTPVTATVREFASLEAGLLSKTMELQ